jgi:3-oxoacyl-[acyl-carrier protein] reductase
MQDSAREGRDMDRTVLVTGSSRGIGRAIALRLARDGYDVVLHCRTRRTEAEQVAAQVAALGRDARMLQFDVGDRGAARAALVGDVEGHGAYYGVVCNAGLTRDSVFAGMTGEEWDTVVRIDLDGLYNVHNVLNPLVLPMVRRRAPGRIVTIASVSGQIGRRGQVNYSAAKAGVIGATKALALELAGRGITVNCVAPGLVDTEMLAGLPVDELVKLVPLQRLGKPDEVAAAVSFLMSDDAGYITRQVIAVNGGLA